MHDGIGKFFTRNGHDWSNSFPFLLTSMEKLTVRNAIFDGEIVALDTQGRSHFQGLQNSLKSKNDKHLHYYIFDLLYLDGVDLRALPLVERKKLLKEVLSESHENIHLSEHVFDEGSSFFALACEHHLEGMISKLIDAPYKSGRNDYWVKTKCKNQQEFVIAGWTEPKGARVGVGALLLGVYEKRELIYVGKVGTGFSSAYLRELHQKLLKLERKTSAFKNSPKGRDLHWVSPKLICEVSYSEKTSEGILRTPVFVALREDKKSQEVFMDQPKKITSPEKLIFKDEKISKEDVLHYYQKISKVMMPYIEDRPLSVVRCPEGSQGECFYQKHLSGKKSQKLTAGKDYFSLDSIEGLEELVQMNAYEIHAWNTHQDHHMYPDQIVMDLDPGPGVTWRQIVQAALELKELLEDLELESFIKVTGGKGVHLHIPIRANYSWDEVKAFAQTLALEMVSRNPTLYVANMSKKLRRNKIFIDYLRNGYGATAVAPYSLRALPQSSVAMPLEWSELKRMKEAGGFTLKKALLKIKNRKADPWERMLELHQEILILNREKVA